MSKEIQTKIAELNKQLEELIDPTTFVLNPKALAINKQINELQAQCKHHPVDGVCEFCGLEVVNE